MIRAWRAHAAIRAWKVLQGLATYIACGPGCGWLNFARNTGLFQGFQAHCCSFEQGVLDGERRPD